MANEIQLPKWVSKVNDQRYVIDIDTAYPILLDELYAARKSYENRAEKFEAEADEAIEQADKDRAKKQAQELRDYAARLAECNPDAPTQYGLEVVYQFAKLDLRRALLLNGMSAWPGQISMKTADKKRWAQKGYKQGRGADKATQGKEARRFYQDIRGFIPN